MNALTNLPLRATRALVGAAAGVLFPAPPRLDGIESSRMAMELVTIARLSKGSYRQAMADAEPLFRDVHPLQLPDVAMTLAGMVVLLANDADYARFGESILRAEATGA